MKCSYLHIIRLRVPSKLTRSQIISTCKCVCSLDNEVIFDSCSLFFRTRTPYGEKKEKFVYALSLVFVQCIVNALFAEAGKLIRVNLLELTKPTRMLKLFHQAS